MPSRAEPQPVPSCAQHVGHELNHLGHGLGQLGGHLTSRTHRKRHSHESGASAPAAAPPPAAAPAAAPPSGPPQPSPYVLLLRVCQGRLNPLDGVGLHNCPKLLLRLATQCCAMEPAQRPALSRLAAELEGPVLALLDPGTLEARRPDAPLRGWRAAAEAAKQLEGVSFSGDPIHGVNGPLRDENADPNKPRKPFVDVEDLD